MCLEIPDLFLVLNMILTRSLRSLDREISHSTLEINLVFPRTMYYSLYRIVCRLEQVEALLDLCRYFEYSLVKKEFIYSNWCHGCKRLQTI